METTATLKKQSVSKIADKKQPLLLNVAAHNISPKYNKLVLLKELLRELPSTK